MTEDSGGGRFAGQPAHSGAQDGAPFSAGGYAGSRPDAAGYPQVQGYGPPGRSPEQLAYERGQHDAVRRLTAPRMTGWRVACGVCWGLWTVLFGVGAIVGLSQGSIGTFLLGAVLAGLAGWYDYRIWTLKARRLTLFIIF